MLLAAILRSWEDRFGARLLSLGPGSWIRLLVERPPRTLQTAQPIAAEHCAFADDCDPARLGASLEQFVGHPAYGTAQLRQDLDRFVFLLGGDDGEALYGSTAPGASANALGSVFNPTSASVAGSVYAGNPGTASLANANSTAAVSQYDIACFRPSP